jgi:CysZ protein
MLHALALAATEITQPTLRRTVLLSIALALVVFLVMWSSLGWALLHAGIFGIGWLDTALNFLGSLAALFVTWLLFPAVVTVISGFFLDSVVREIEARHYPELPPARAQSWGEIVFAMLRLVLAAVVLNLVALPFYLFVPGINLVVFYGLNGYLLGREYFELVALRRLDFVAARRLRRARSAHVLAAGVAIAFLFTVPLLNLAAPVVAAAFMLHLFEKMRRRDPLAV